MASESSKIAKSKIIFTVIYLLIWPALLLFLSKDWLWLEGWIFNIWFISICLKTIIYLYRNDPALLAERFKKPGAANQKKWDKYVVSILVITFMLWFIVMPLDAKRYNWTVSFPLWLKILGVALLLISFFFMYRSYVENSFVSALVRIQTERKHQVVSTGVYGLVRHPMYLGGILFFIGTPMLLGSKYGILIGIALSFLIIGRIIGEEKMLINELEGYADYKKKVKYRLIPFIW